MRLEEVFTPLLRTLLAIIIHSIKNTLRHWYFTSAATTPIAQTTSRPPKGPQLKTSDGLEDLIIPEQMPLLGPGDTELRSEISKNTTEKDIEQFLRATLEEDDQRRKAIAIEGPGQSING